jgi:hypothetical protein
MARMGVQRMHQRGALQDQPNACVAMAVDPAFVTLRQPKPTLQVEIILDRVKALLAYEQALEKTEHHRGHVVTDRIVGLLELVEQLLEPLLALGAILGPGFEGRRHLRNHFDVFSDYLLLLLDLVQTALDASGQARELLLGEPPFFSSKFRWSEAWTYCKASAIRKPGG